MQCLLDRSIVAEDQTIQQRGQRNQDRGRLAFNNDARQQRPYKINAVTFRGIFESENPSDRQCRRRLISSNVVDTV